MATTTPDGIYYPISTTQIAPLETQFSTLATSVQTAMTNKKQITVATAAALGALTLATYPNYLAYVSGNGSLWYNTGTKWQLANIPNVASSAARDALYSGLATLTQGDQVFRNDLGYQETYYALYNSGTNPGGKAAAGWYSNQRNTGLVPVSPTGLTANAGTASYNSNVITVTGVGSIKVQGCFTAAFRNYRILLNFGNTTANDGFYFSLISGTTQSAATQSYQAIVSSIGTISSSNAGSQTFIQVAATSSSNSAIANYAGSVIDVQAPMLSTYHTGTFSSVSETSTTHETRHGGWKNMTQTPFDGFMFYTAALGAWSGTIQIFGYNG